MFRQKWTHRKNSWNFEKFWQFYEENVANFWTNGYFKFWNSLEFKNAWNKFFNSCKDLKISWEDVLDVWKEKKWKYLRIMLRIVITL